MMMLLLLLMRMGMRMVHGHSMLLLHGHGDWRRGRNESRINHHLVGMLILMRVLVGVVRKFGRGEHRAADHRT